MVAITMMSNENNGIFFMLLYLISLSVKLCVALCFSGEMAKNVPQKSTEETQSTTKKSFRFHKIYSRLIIEFSTS